MYRARRQRKMRRCWTRFGYVHLAVMPSTCGSRVSGSLIVDRPYPVSALERYSAMHANGLFLERHHGLQLQSMGVLRLEHRHYCRFALKNSFHFHENLYRYSDVEQLRRQVDVSSA